MEEEITKAIDFKVVSEVPRRPVLCPGWPRQPSCPSVQGPGMGSGYYNIAQAPPQNISIEGAQSSMGDYTASVEINSFYFSFQA